MVRTIRRRHGSAGSLDQGLFKPLLNPKGDQGRSKQGGNETRGRCLPPIRPDVRVDLLVQPLQRCQLHGSHCQAEGIRNPVVEEYDRVFLILMMGEKPKIYEIMNFSKIRIC